MFVLLPSFASSYLTPVSSYIHANLILYIQDAGLPMLSGKFAIA